MYSIDKLKIHSDFFTKKYNTDTYIFNTVFAEFLFPFQQLFCSPNNTYVIPFNAANFILSSNLKIDISGDTEYLDTAYINRTGDTTGTLTIRMLPRALQNYVTTTIKITDVDNGVQSTFNAHVGTNSITGFTMATYDLTISGGILSGKVSPSGLPGGTQQWYYVAKPSITVMMSDGSNVEYSVVGGVNIFNQAMMMRNNASYVQHLFQVVLNQSVFGTVVVTWTDEISGFSVSQSKEVKYTKT